MCNNVSLEWRLNTEARRRLQSCKDISEYMSVTKRIFEIESRSNPALAGFKDLAFRIECGALIRGCQLIRKQEFWYSAQSVAERVDPAFITICIPWAPGNTAVGGLGFNIANVLVDQPNVLVMIDCLRRGSSYPNSLSCQTFVGSDSNARNSLPGSYWRKYHYGTLQKPKWTPEMHGWCAQIDIGEASQEPRWFTLMEKTYITIAESEINHDKQERLAGLLNSAIDKVLNQAPVFRLTKQFRTVGMPQQLCV